MNKKCNNCGWRFKFSKDHRSFCGVKGMRMADEKIAAQVNMMVWKVRKAECVCWSPSGSLGIVDVEVME